MSLCMTCVDPCGNQRKTTVSSAIVQLMPLKPGLSLNLELLGPQPQPPVTQVFGSQLLEQRHPAFCC